VITVSSIRQKLDLQLPGFCEFGLPSDKYEQVLVTNGIATTQSGLK
jgi:hypothetical protein